ncbi:hypothetical protein BHE74_00004475 [Ensete ventricosum]|nr:hypothetical protein BHE74_00004475 [Ensete ventricosum]RZR82154.1 hypothetical protein BHM03_00008518 [Ensete ventricosum]
MFLPLQSDESIYECECGNMPGFAVYYRFPNSQRVTYGQFIRVCSLPYFAVYTLQVAKIKGDEREDLKVLATGVAAALAARKMRSQQKRTMHNSILKPAKQEVIKEDSKTGKLISRTTGQQSSFSADKDASFHPADSRQGGTVGASGATNGISVSASGKMTSSSRMMLEMHETVEISEASIKQKRTVQGEEQERLNKRKKGDVEAKDLEGMEVRVSDKERSYDTRSVDKEHEKSSTEELSFNRSLDKSKEKINERYDKDHREKLDRSDKDLHEKSRDRSLERHGRERSVEKVQERGMDRSLDRAAEKARDDRSKDDRSKSRHMDVSIDKAHLDERFHGQSLPPPPPLPPSFVPQSVGGSRRDEETDRRVGNTRHMQRLSPKHDEKERRRSEENVLTSQDDPKRRREDDLRERKRDERDGSSVKVDDRDRDKATMMKEDMDLTGGSKRRKLKRDHALSSETGGEYSQVVPPPPPVAIAMPQSFDRERADKKAAMVQQRAAYMDEASRMHGKEAGGKINRRESDQYPYPTELFLYTYLSLICMILLTSRRFVLSH